MSDAKQSNGKLPESTTTQSATNTITFCVQNQTPYRIGIETRSAEGSTESDDLFVLAPFGSRDINAATKKIFDFASWEFYDLIEYKKDSRLEEQEQSSWLMTIGFTTAVIILWLVLGIPLAIFWDNLAQLIGKPTINFMNSLFLFLFCLTLFLLVATIIIIKFFPNRMAGKHLRYSLQRIGLWSQKSPYVLLVLIIGLGMPGLTIYIVGGGQDIFNKLYTGKIHDLGLLGLGRFLQFLFLSLATIFPAMLYLLFGQKKLETVHDTFVKHILMLDPTVYSRREASEKYQSLLEEVYGISNLGNLNQLRGAATPLIISTIFIAMGWTLALFPDQIPENLTIDETIHTLFSPTSAPIVFGFLGTYFFSLNMIFRRYVRGDLNPKTYIHISVRILITFILAWTLTAIFENTWLFTFLPLITFMIGIIPETGTTLLQEEFKKIASSKSAKASQSTQYSLEDDHPLTTLEGINIYDRARFQEEGINNIENLVFYDLIELIARTRVPIYRLLDLYDQAILHMHLGIQHEQIDKNIKKLRLYGIRSATDLLIAKEENPEIVRSIILTEIKESSDQDDGEQENSQVSENNAPSNNSREEHSPVDLEIICAIIAKHNWIPNLQYWREFHTQPVSKKKLADLGYNPIHASTLAALSPSNKQILSMNLIRSSAKNRPQPQ